MAIGDELKQYTWKNIMNMMLSQVSSDMDKRQGSIIYDSCSPSSTACATIVELMRNVYLNTFVGTAQGDYLDARVEEAGLERIEATNAIRRVLVYDTSGTLTDVTIGTLVTPKGDGTLLFALTEKESTGTYKARCTTAGTVGNSYTGDCELISNLTGIGTVTMTDVITSARDEETDAELRARHKESTGTSGFGGNIADYRSLVGTTLTDVGQMQVYPRTSSDTTIVLSVVDADGDPFSSEELTTIQETLDPSDYPGQGNGVVPIGHHPTVVSPTEVTTDVTMTITPATGKTVAELTSAVTEAVEDYFDDLRDNWATLTSTYGYSVKATNAGIVAAVIAVEGVSNVTNITIGGGTVGADKTYTESKSTQEMPKCGTVTIS